MSPPESEVKSKEEKIFNVVKPDIYFSDESTGEELESLYQFNEKINKMVEESKQIEENMKKIKEDINLAIKA